MTEYPYQHRPITANHLSNYIFYNIFFLLHWISFLILQSKRFIDNHVHIDYKQ